MSLSASETKTLNCVVNWPGINYMELFKKIEPDDLCRFDETIANLKAAGLIMEYVATVQRIRSNIYVSLFFPKATKLERV